MLCRSEYGISNKFANKMKAIYNCPFTAVKVSSFGWLIYYSECVAEVAFLINVCADKILHM